MAHPLLDGPPASRVGSMTALLESAGPVERAELDALCACLADPRKLIQRRAAETLATLAGRGEPIADRLRRALGAPTMRERWGAVYALSLIGPVPVEALPILLEVLGSEDGDLRWAAADLIKAVAGTERPTVVAALLAAARAPTGARKMALYCLRDLGVSEAYAIALDTLADAPIETRLAALALLARVHADPAAAARRIAALIDDGDPRMRRAAAGTLGGLGVRSPEVLDALRRAEASDDPSLRRAAAQSLAKLT